MFVIFVLFLVEQFTVDHSHGLSTYRSSTYWTSQGRAISPLEVLRLLYDYLYELLQLGFELKTHHFPVSPSSNVYLYLLLYFE